VSFFCPLDVYTRIVHQRFIDERLPPLTEVALAASALAELRHGRRNAGVDALKRLIRGG
jgi:hypothetical protein